MRRQAVVPQVESFEAMQARGAQLAGREDGDEEDEEEEDGEVGGARLCGWFSVVPTACVPSIADCLSRLHDLCSLLVV